MNELNMIKLNIYEAFDNGEITEAEKYYLLEQADKHCSIKETISHKLKMKAIDDYIKDQEKIGGIRANIKKTGAKIYKKSEENKFNNRR